MARKTKPTALIAAASRRTLDQIRTTPLAQDATNLWALYDQLGELGYGVGFKSVSYTHLTLPTILLV